VWRWAQVPCQMVTALVAQTGTVPRARINNYGKRQQRSGECTLWLCSHFLLSGPPLSQLVARASQRFPLAEAHGNAWVRRCRALLLIGFAPAASELVALDVTDLEECAEGLRVTIRRSKTDQEGAASRGAFSCRDRVRARVGDLQPGH
jgi:hypothetical protein